jgi:hypothetical protein
MMGSSRGNTKLSVAVRESGEIGGVEASEEALRSRGDGEDEAELNDMMRRISGFESCPPP